MDSDGAGTPSIAAMPDGNVVIASLGENYYNIWYTIPGVQGWTSTGSYFVGVSDASVGVDSGGTINLVVRGTYSTICVRRTRRPGLDIYGRRILRQR